MWNSRKFLKKLKIKLPYDLQSHSRAYIQRKETCIPMFTGPLFTIAKAWKQPKCSTTEEWIKKTWYIYTIEYYSVIEWSDAICSNMNGPRDYHTKWKKPDIEKQHVASFIMWNLKKWYKWTCIQTYDYQRVREG